MAATLKPFIDYLQKYAARIDGAKNSALYLGIPSIAKQYKKELQKSVDEWYFAYSPIHYSRKSVAMDWFICYPQPKNGRIYAQLTSRGVSASNQSPDWVFYLAVFKGYHGGSFGKADYNGVVPSVPMWRSPYPDGYTPGAFDHWSSVAYASEPIINIVNRRRYEKLPRWQEYLQRLFISQLSGGASVGKARTLFERSYRTLLQQFNN